MPDWAGLPYGLTAGFGLQPLAAPFPGAYAGYAGAEGLVYLG